MSVETPEDDSLPLQQIRMRVHVQEQGGHGEAQELPHERRTAKQGRIQKVHEARRLRVRR